MAQKKFLSQEGLAIVWDRIDEVFTPREEAATKEELQEAVQQITQDVVHPDYLMTLLNTPNAGAIASYRLTKNGEPAGVDIDLPAAIVADYRVSITAQTDGLGESIAKRYTFTQLGEEIGCIDLPKDMVVTSGSVDTVVVEDIPYDGAKIGDKYIRLVIANQEIPLYIPANTLVEDFTGVQSSDTIELTETDNHVIMASIKPNSITPELLAETYYTASEIDTKLQAIELPLASQEVAGIVKLSEEFTINELNQLTIKKVNIKLLEQNENDWLIFDGGTAAIGY